MTGQSRTAAGLMKEIKNRFFLPGSGSNLISLKMQLWELSMPEDGSSVILIDQVQRLVQKLKTLCNSTTQEEDQIVILLKALPPSFAMLRAQMDVKYAMGESLNFHQACAAVRLFETSPARKDLAAEATAKDSALYGASAKGGNSARKPGNCNNCGKPGHWAAECRGKKRETANTKGGACHHCNKPGHFKRNCPELKQRGTPDERVFIAAMPTSFVLDSGATSHIVTDRSSLATATPANTHILGIGGERAQATHEGTLANFPGKALVVPTAQCNIISIKQLTKNGWSAIERAHHHVRGQPDGYDHGTRGDYQAVQARRHQVPPHPRAGGAGPHYHQVLPHGGAGGRHANQATAQGAIHQVARPHHGELRRSVEKSTSPRMGRSGAITVWPGGHLPGT